MAMASTQRNAAQPNESMTIDNKYKILEKKIRRWEYGRVYKGRDLETGDLVTIKQAPLEDILQEDLDIIIMLCAMFSMVCWYGVFNKKSISGKMCIHRYQKDYLSILLIFSVNVSKRMRCKGPTQRHY
ncbi:hypothetical protein BS78_06G269000 [Paspalum vaginatum]|nr:hypothetical protein BS78_06G269000 [Paspalum vaginatum]